MNHYLIFALGVFVGVPFGWLILGLMVAAKSGRDFDDE